MTKLKVYTDRGLTNEITDSILLEGDTYYLDVSSFEVNHCKMDFEGSGLSDFLDWHPRNTVATLKLVNVVGFIKILDHTFDVRSKKLYSKESGENQFNRILKDIDDITKGINFNYSGVAFSTRQIDELDLSPTILERFEYYRQLVNDFPTQQRLDTLIALVLKNPHSTFQYFKTKEDISTIKQPTISFTRNIRSRDIIQLSAQSDLNATPLAKALLKNTGKHLFLQKVESNQKNIIFDTLENQFVKFLLTDITNICIRIYTSKGIPGKIKQEAHQIKAKVSLSLNSTFFRKISNLRFFPNSSSVLTGRAGYRELYYHYIQSRFGFFNLIDDITKKSIKSGLKDIASLYEIWVFFKIAKECFNENLTIMEQKRIFKGNNVSWGFTFKDDDIQLSYNTSYSLSKHTSYSLRLRPDVTLKINNNLYFFDAKYKIDFSSQFDEDSSTFKQEDIHKMHCYIDAIDRAKAAFVVYPGTEFKFFQKYAYNKIASSNELVNPRGVGAIPLNTSIKSLDLSNVIAIIKRDDIETI